VNDAAPASGPFFLDGDKQPQNGTSTGASGWAVLFNVPEGLVTITAANGSGYTFEAPATPTAAGTVSLVQVTAKDGAAVTPTNVSFSLRIVPIFKARGCTVCHSGGGIGKDLGGLMLDVGNDKVYKELTEEISPNYPGQKRVNLAEPPKSLLLTLPSPEDPPDRHPNVTFASPSDPDYQLILAWIIEGAKNN
jgi:hypothetical protein